MSQVRNSMETKTEQSFELLEVRNKSKLLQKYIHALQMNLQFIVTLVEGYIPVVIGSKAIMHECKKRIAILSKFAIYFYRYIVDEKKIDIAHAYCILET